MSMEVKVEKYPISSGLTQTNLAASPILCQCLFVIQTVSEFKNLSHRVTKTRNGEEVVVVYREGVLGIFGPPADPITLTLDPKGRCLLTILFKPVQRVCIVSPESGQIDIPSLLTLLRLIAGKGYLFCPGLPERFLAGKGCGKHVVLHRVPFKRYQAAQCPVYYQAPVFQQNTTKHSLCVLCPRCMQAAKLIHTLPTISSNAAGGAAAHLPMQVTVPDQLKSDQKHAIDNTSGGNLVIKPSNDYPVGVSLVSDSVSRLLALTNCHNSAPSEPQMNKTCRSSLDSSVVDVNGNSRGAVALKGSHEVIDQKTADYRKPRLDEDIQIMRSLLTKMLYNGCKKRAADSSCPGTEIEGVKAVKEDVASPLKYHLDEDSHPKSNVCRHCRKQYSTPAQLMNHVQRHEVLSTTWRKRFRERKHKRKPIFFSLTHGIRESKFHSALNKERPSHLSETTIRLFLKRLNDLIPSQNGASRLKHPRLNVRVKHEAVEKQNCSEGQHFVPFEHIEKKSAETRSVMKRTSSGLSPMQTLLEAAAIAEVDQSESNIFLNPSHSTFTSGKYQQSEMVPDASQSTNVSPEPLEFNLPLKKPRKSTRLASKREKKRARGNNDFAEVPETDSVSHEQSMLTNLNLLSTVSLQTSMRQAPTNQPTDSSSLPRTVSSPEIKKHFSVFPHSSSTTISFPSPKDSFPAQPMPKSVSISQPHINNTSGGNVVISKAQEVCRPIINANLQIKPSSLPPIPPLLFAGDSQRHDLLYHVLSQGQTVPVSMPSILRSLVTVTNKSQGLTSSDSESTKSQNSSCGAMDLSKPKPSQTKPTISSSKADIDLSSLSGLPHNIAQLVAGNDNPSEVLQCFMMMTKAENIAVLENKDVKPITSIISDKQSDSELQARMFASACNYRIDKSVSKSQQVHSVIASSSRISKLGKGVKPADVSAVQADEIQCGYKWSGSGGSVKERTQMVRELVPPDVMASFFTKSQLSNNALQQLSVNLLNASQQASPELVHTSLPGWSAHSKSQEPTASDLAVDPITIKSSETSVSKKEVSCRTELSTPGSVTSSSHLTIQGSSASSVSKKKNFKGVSTSPEVLNQLKIRLSNSASSTTTTTTSSSSRKSKHKSTSQKSNSCPSPHRAIQTPPSASAMSSPSLAAMLRQPVAYEPNHTIIPNISVAITSPLTSLTHQTPTADSSVWIMPGEFQIKSEPLDTYSLQKSRIVPVPIKTENEDTNVEMADDTSRDSDRSPADLVVDMGSQSHGEEIGQKLRLLTSPVSSSVDLFYCKQTAK